jgi:hypothetical protein
MEFAAIADQLRETREFAIDPMFTEQLRVLLLEMMRRYAKEHILGED